MENLDSRVDSEVFALDATAFYQGFHLYTYHDCITTNMICEEISHIQNKFAILDCLLLSQRVKVIKPNEDTVQLVQSIAMQIGEYDLTPADVSIISLAKDHNARLVTDDFTICNLVKIMSIQFLNLGTSGIKNTRKWVKFCNLCGKGYHPSLTICTICGSKLRTRYKKLNESIK